MLVVLNTMSPVINSGDLILWLRMTMIVVIVQMMTLMVQQWM